MQEIEQVIQQKGFDAFLEIIFATSDEYENNTGNKSYLLKTK